MNFQYVFFVTTYYERSIFCCIYDQMPEKRSVSWLVISRNSLLSWAFLSSSRETYRLSTLGFFRVTLVDTAGEAVILGIKEIRRDMSLCVNRIRREQITAVICKSRIEILDSVEDLLANDRPQTRSPEIDKPPAATN